MMMIMMIVMIIGLPPARLLALRGAPEALGGARRPEVIIIL